jgi:hypothetical protein
VAGGTTVGTDPADSNAGDTIPPGRPVPVKAVRAASLARPTAIDSVAVGTAHRMVGSGDRWNQPKAIHTHVF